MKSKLISVLMLAAAFAGTSVSCGTVDNLSDSSAPAIEETSESNTTDTAAEKTTAAAKTTDAAKTTEATEAQTTQVKTTELSDPGADNAPDEDLEAYTPEPQNDEPNNNDAPAEEPAENNEPPAPEQAVGSFSDSDLSFNGASLLGDASGLISSLGAASSVDEAESCLNNGADMKIYHYPGLDVSCYIDGESEIIFDITITGGYSTPKGITVGSSRADVVAAYGEGDGNCVVYGSESYGLYINYSGDTVVSIDYYAEA